MDDLERKIRAVWGGVTELRNIITSIDNAVPGELVFEAYIRQVGGSDPQSQSDGNLVIGTTYNIDNYIVGDDFTNVGASDNANGVIFIATGTTPTIWSNGSNLLYNIGAPTCSYILKNTLDCKGFKYTDIGTYSMIFPNNLVELNLFVTIGTLPSTETPMISTYSYLSIDKLLLYTIKGVTLTDDYLISYIKVVVLP